MHTCAHTHKKAKHLLVLKPLENEHQIGGGLGGFMRALRLEGWSVGGDDVGSRWGMDGGGGRGGEGSW